MQFNRFEIMIKKCVITFMMLIMTVSIYTCSNSNQPLYLVIYWHQHQPSYLDAEKGHLLGPWVRTHSTKDYFDMAAVVEKYPNVHLTVDLSSILLTQIKEYYVDKLGEFINLENNSIDAEGFLQKWGKKTDPWIDLMLKESSNFTQQDMDYLMNVSGNQAWHCFSITEQIISRFPEYLALVPEGISNGNISGTKDPDSFTLKEKRLAKFFFYLAYFDPAFFVEKVELPIKDEKGNDVFVDITDLAEYSDNGTPDDASDDSYTLTKEITENDCKRLLVETYKIMASVIPIHKKLLYDPETEEGQIEVVTTPYSHPILPLLIDTDIMQKNRPSDPRPDRFSYPRDADLQIKLGIKLYEEHFGKPPYGIWPSEGSISEAALELLAENNIKWAASGPHNLARSLGKDHHEELNAGELGKIYSVKFSDSPPIAALFRDLSVSDDIAFNYGQHTTEENIESFFSSMERYIRQAGREETVVTILLDGENAWEFFEKDNDGWRFFRRLYEELENKYNAGEIVTVTPVEYIMGNEKRGIPAHPVENLKQIEDLHPGCWFSPDFTTWIGETEENKGWDYLTELRSRMDEAEIPFPGLDNWNTDTPFMKGWKAVFEAEGSDWFWWYGSDQTSGGGGDVLFDQNFRSHLNSAYTFFKEAGYDIEAPILPRILEQEKRLQTGPMAGDIRIDGNLSELSWTEKSGYFNDDDGGAQFSKNDILKRIYYGNNENGLYLGLTCSFEDFESRFNRGEYTLELILGSKDSPEIQVKYAKINKTGSIIFSSSNGRINIKSSEFEDIISNVEIDNKGNIVELFLPVEIADKADSYLFVVKTDRSMIIDVAPDHNPFYFSKDRKDQIKIVFECDATDVDVTDKIYICGATENIGSWIPNRVRMYDDGTHGDKTSGDGIWSLEVNFEEGYEILYKYTNSGREGVWSPGEEFGVENRQIIVRDIGDGTMLVRNVFGDIKK